MAFALKLAVVCFSQTSLPSDVSDVSSAAGDGRFELAVLIRVDVLGPVCFTVSFTSETLASSDHVVSADAFARALGRSDACVSGSTALLASFLACFVVVRVRRTRLAGSEASGSLGVCVRAGRARDFSGRARWSVVPHRSFVTVVCGFSHRGCRDCVS